MSTATTFPFALPSASDVAIHLFDQSKLEYKETVKDRNSITATYVYADGTGAPSETYVELKSIVDVAKDVIIQSITLTTIQTITVDSEIASQTPFSIKLQWTQSVRFFDPALTMSWIGAAFSLAFPSLDTKVPTTGTLGKFNNDLLNGVY